MMIRSKLTRIAATLSLALIASGCAVQPLAITADAHQQRAAEDQRRLFDEQDAVKAPLTLYAAIARALKYNLDYRVKLMEEAVALGQTQLANYDLMPKMTMAAGYTTRNNDAFGFGYQPNGSISTTPSAAQERNHGFENLSFSWNVLDFGLSYLRAKQLADQSLITEERRRKAQQTLILDVRNAWWRVEAAQRLIPETDALLDELERAGARAKLIESRKLLPPLQIVAYKRSLLDLEQQISLRRQELLQAPMELAQLLNLRPGLDYSVAAPGSDLPPPPDLSASINTLEQIAIGNRPELREEGYRARISDLEANKQWLSLLPSATLDWGNNHDTNKYLVNNRWSSAGLNLSWNMLKLVSIGSLKEANQANARADETRRLALTAAVLAQTRIAALRYRLLTQEFAIWDDAVNDDTRVVGYLSAAKQVGLETELELVRAKARNMVSKINRDLVYANVQGALGRLYNSIGMDPLPQTLESAAPEALALALEKTLKTWEDASFAPKAAKTQGQVALMPVTGLAKKSTEAFSASQQRILRLAKVALAENEQATPYRIETSVSFQRPGLSGQPATMKVKLLDNSGKVLYENEQNSMLMNPVTLDQWRAMGEGAGYRMIEPVRRHLSRLAAGSETPAQENAPPPATTAPDKPAAGLKLDAAAAVTTAMLPPTATTLSYNDRRPSVPEPRGNATEPAILEDTVAAVKAVPRSEE